MADRAFLVRKLSFRDEHTALTLTAMPSGHQTTETVACVNPAMSQGERCECQYREEEKWEMLERTLIFFESLCAMIFAGLGALMVILFLVEHGHTWFVIGVSLTLLVSHLALTLHKKKVR